MSTGPAVWPWSRTSRSRATPRCSRWATWSMWGQRTVGRRCPGSLRSRCSRAATPPGSSGHACAAATTRRFATVDKGNLATIGRSKAVADVKGVHLSGFPAWATWLLVHIAYLIGFQNRALVLLRWTVSFVTSGRGARLIVSPRRVRLGAPGGRSPGGSRPR